MVRHAPEILTGLGVGVSLMYLLDPERGRRRRARVRDRVARAANRTVDTVQTTRRDAMNRATGVVARLRRSLHHESVDDCVLVERVRGRLGRVVSHPHALEVEAEEGVITLKGPILEAEVDQLLSAVRHVRGVHKVVNALRVHAEPGAISALQGGTMPAGRRRDVWQRTWSPTARLLAGTTGTALAGYGTVRRDAPGVLLAGAGLGLLACAAGKLDARRLAQSVAP